MRQDTIPNAKVVLQSTMEHYVPQALTSDQMTAILVPQALVSVLIQTKSMEFTRQRSIKRCLNRLTKDRKDVNLIVDYASNYVLLVAVPKIIQDQIQGP